MPTPGNCNTVENCLVKNIILSAHIFSKNIVRKGREDDIVGRNEAATIKDGEWTEGNE